MNETDLLHAFIERAPHVLSDVRVFRRSIISRTVEIEGRRVHLRNGIPGQGDAYALVKGGFHVELETKAARGTLADAQKAWRAWCERWDVPHLVLRARKGESPDDTVSRWIAELGRVVHATAA